MSDEPSIDAVVRRARAILAVRDSGGSHMPENPFEVLREAADCIERLAASLADVLHDTSAFTLSPEQYDKFVRECEQAGEPTPASVRGAALLEKLFATPSPWEK